jgi:hypothetical protein
MCHTTTQSTTIIKKESKFKAKSHIERVIEERKKTEKKGKKFHVDKLHEPTNFTSMKI